MPVRPPDASSLAQTPQNRAAGRVLAQARHASGLSQAAFLAGIGERLARRPYAQNALSAWESAERAVPAAVLIAAAEIAEGTNYNLASAIEHNLKEIPTVIGYLWVTADVSIPRGQASPVERSAFTQSIVGAYNSRFKKQSEVEWAGDGRSVRVSMAAGGYSTAEIEESVKDMIKRCAAKGASIAAEHEVGVRVVKSRPL